MARKYRVTLTAEERVELEGMLGKGKADARKLTHARIRLQTDAGDGGPGRTDEQGASGLNVSTRTVERVRRRFVEDGLQASLLPKPTRRIYARVLDGAQEAHLIALACTKPPAGKRRWTFRLLAEQVVELGYAAAVSHETVRRVLKKTS
jgi:transposase